VIRAGVQCRVAKPVAVPELVVVAALALKE
jgi:hypothetical protein